MLMRSVILSPLTRARYTYLFRMFEEASDFLEKPGLRLKRKRWGVLGDQCKYDSKLGH